MKIALGRRKALALAGLGGLGIAAPIASRWWTRRVPQVEPFAPDAVGDLSAVSGNSPEDCVAMALAALGGMGRFVSAGDQVLIKPNFSCPRQGVMGTNTNLRVVRSLAQLALAAGAASVSIADGPVRGAPRDSGLLPSTNGYLGLLDVARDDFGAGSAYSDVEFPSGLQLPPTRVASAAVEADVVINVPVAKSHSAAQVSFGLKNNMGLLQDPEAWHRSGDLGRSIAEFATTWKPDLTVIDATEVLLTGGPWGPGESAALGTVIASPDPLAADLYALQLTPWNGRDLLPHDVPHLRYAMELGVGESDLSKLEIVEMKI